MRRPLITAILCIPVAGSLVLPAAAPAATRSKAPRVTLVSPMRVAVGANLNIYGRGFSSRRSRNTVIFRAPSGRTVFVKPRRASRRKLVVKVPAGVAPLLSRQDDRPAPTRFKLRVLSRRFSRFTVKRLSPVIVPVGYSGPGGGGPGGGGPGGGGACGSGSDWDGDLLSNSFESQINTDPCLSDTDGDGVEDGYEEQSAIDLNTYPGTPPPPYPGKRPYPNALDPSDAGADYDDDALQLREEYLLWLRYSADGTPRSGRPTSLSGLLYSDGLQRSTFLAAPPAGTLSNWVLDQDGDGQLADDERDADGDGLGNWDELRGRLTEAWWPAQHDGEHEPKESPYPSINFLDNPDLPAHDAHADPDIDGDGIADGDDDSDHDGLSNQFELNRPGDWQTDAWADPAAGVPGPNSWAYVNPFNPCKPYNSERCHSHPPFGYYDDDEMPPVGPNPPAGYPGSHPTTPDG